MMAPNIMKLAIWCITAVPNWLNIPHSQNVINYEHFINTHYQMQDESMDHWEEWKRTPEADQLVKAILRENRVG